MRSRTAWIVALTIIVAVGIVSRLVHTGFILLDKYLGDALYAAMVYVIFRIIRGPKPVALLAALTMIGVEAFQLTLIPARLLSSEHLIVRLCARLLGTHFEFLDLLAYAVGIGILHLIDARRAEN